MREEKVWQVAKIAWQVAKKSSSPPFLYTPAYTPTVGYALAADFSAMPCLLHEFALSQCMKETEKSLGTLYCIFLLL